MKFLSLAYCVVIFVFPIVCSCQKKLGKYIYLDANEVLHFQKDCQGVAKADGSFPVYPYEVKFCDGWLWYGECSKCVDDCRKEALEAIVRHNLKIREKRKSLYDVIVGKYDLPDFNTFNREMDKALYRKRLYEKLKEDGYSMGSWATDEGIK